MRPKERVIAALHHREPDRVPTFEWDIDSGLIRRMTRGGTYEAFLDMSGAQHILRFPWAESWLRGV